MNIIKISCKCPNHGSISFPEREEADNDKILDMLLEQRRARGCWPIVTCSGAVRIWEDAPIIVDVK